MNTGSGQQREPQKIKSQSHDKGIALLRGRSMQSLNRAAKDDWFANIPGLRRLSDGHAIRKTVERLIAADLLEASLLMADDDFLVKDGVRVSRSVIRRILEDGKISHSEADAINRSRTRERERNRKAARSSGRPTD